MILLATNVRETENIIDQKLPMEYASNVPILLSLKTPETFGCLVFSEGIKYEHWPQMG